LTEQRKDRYTAYLEWIAECDDFDLPEALVMSRVAQWPEGCWESYSTIAKKVKLDRRTVIRAVARLIGRGYVVCRKRGRRQNVLMVERSKWVNMPLCRPKGSVSQTPPAAGGSVTETPGSVRESPKVVSESHPNIYSIDNEEILGSFVGSLMKKQGSSPPSRAEIDRRRRMQRDGLGL
jgi:hypothetical protein